MEMDKSINVFGEVLESCCINPVTGVYRDGKCNTSKADIGSHTVCIKVTNEFLEYSKSKGNDLSTPVPEFNFKGLKAGNSWCLCASRWLEAEKDNMAPRIHLTRTHIKALDIVPMTLLKKYAVDLN
jgi:uncharacterized protein (DUF2237 family)